MDIVGTVVRNNRIGAQFAADGSSVRTSLFDRNTDTQLDVAAGNSATVARNAFDGAGVSAIGVLVSGTSATFAGTITSNDIGGHGTAVQSTAAATQAPRNWWGAGMGSGCRRRQRHRRPCESAAGAERGMGYTIADRERSRAKSA